MQYRLKIVPDYAPNADGRWIVVAGGRRALRTWRQAEAYFAPHIPEGEHLVQYMRED